MWDRCGASAVAGRGFGLTAVALAAALLLPGAAVAHPHVWVDSGVEVIFDAQGRAEAIRLTWVFDEFYSLATVEEMGLDADHDGNATPAEAAQLSGFNMKWVPGFAGDTYVLSGARELALSGPLDWTAQYRGGRITTTHLRRIEPAAPLEAPLQVQVYDPGFYIAYSLVLPSVLTPALPEGCVAQVYVPDRDAADEQLLAALAEYGADESVEMDFPAVGAAYSEELRITCGAP